MAKKTKQLNIRVTEYEFDALQQKMDARNYTNLSEFILTSIIKPENLGKKKLTDLVYEINKIGHNLNQLTRKVHQEKEINEFFILTELTRQNYLLSQILKAQQ